MNSAIDTENGYTYTGGAVVAIMPRGGMSNEATHCDAFADVGTSTQASLTDGGYLVVGIGDETVTIQSPVSISAVIIGAGIGAVSSVPVTNALLEGQVQSQNNQQSQVDESFGRPGNMPGNMPSNMPGNMPGNMGGFPGGSMGDMPSDLPDMGGTKPFSEMFGEAADYITEVDSAMNLTVVFQMIGVGLFLTMVAGAASVLFIMRYDPLKILANRD